VRGVYVFVVSIILCLVGGLFSLYEGFHKFHHPEELRDRGIAIGVLYRAGHRSWVGRLTGRMGNGSAASSPAVRQQDVRLAD
jgi:hypothetical protein